MRLALRRVEGPIPARTGETLVRSLRCRQSGAYPRSHGGDRLLDGLHERPKGLSPLARGRLQPGQLVGAAGGPIPARTGETDPPATSWPQDGAYPRSHGGDRSYGSVRGSSNGLSPLARGRRRLRPWPESAGGPIPARTGETNSTPSISFTHGAYPRSHGGDTPRSPDVVYSLGLSPLARGRPDVTGTGWTLIRPIPARTGETSPAPHARRPAGAYPRSHGGDSFQPNTTWSHQGLSPLARGRPVRGRWPLPFDGPIPARTGETTMIGCTANGCGAYPRSHGGDTAKPAQAGV